MSRADQVGSAIPKLCWDSSHGHTLGGGNFWVTGYQAMMDAIATALYNQQGQGNQRPSEKVSVSGAGVPICVGF